MTVNSEGDTLGDVYRDIRAADSWNAGKRRKEAKQQLPEAAARAAEAGLQIRQHSESEFILSRPGAWRLSLYPGKQRIYRGRGNVQAPFLQLDSSRDWTIMDAVNAAIEGERHASGGV